MHVDDSIYLLRMVPRRQKGYPRNLAGRINSRRRQRDVRLRGRFRAPGDDLPRRRADPRAEPTEHERL